MSSASPPTSRLITFRNAFLSGLLLIAPLVRFPFWVGRARWHRAWKRTLCPAAKGGIGDVALIGLQGVV